VQREEEEKKR